MASDFCTIQDRMRHLNGRLRHVSPELRAQLNRALDVSWVYHDAALEGSMLDADEILAAFDGGPPAQGSTAMVAARVRSLKLGLDGMRRELRVVQPFASSLEQLKRLHLLITPDEADRGGRYRQVPSVHRAYYHDIAKPSRISYLLRKLFAWLHSEEARRLHPIQVAGHVHHTLLRVWPFEVNSGAITRMYCNLLLQAYGYLPAVVHARDRQRYFRALAQPASDSLAALLAASLDNSLSSCERFLQQAAPSQRRRAGRAA